MKGFSENSVCEEGFEVCAGAEDETSMFPGLSVLPEEIGPVKEAMLLLLSACACTCVCDCVSAGDDCGVFLAPFRVPIPEDEPLSLDRRV